MSKRREIFNLIERFVKGLQTNDQDEIKAVLAQDVSGNLSTAGEISGNKALSEKLLVQNFDYSISRFTVLNPVVRTDGDRAQASFYVMSLIGKVHTGFLHSAEWGGKYIISLEAVDNQWMIKSMKYDLDWVKGNTEFINNWTLLDYAVYSGHKPSISSEYDSPWDVIPENDESRSSEEEISEVMFKYSFGLDNCDFRLHKTSYTDSVVFYAGSKIMESGARNLINNFKNTSHKEHSLQHAIKIVSIVIAPDQESAELIGYRVEPHRLGSKNLNLSTLESNFYSAKYTNKFIKIEGKWVMTELHYDAKVFVEPRLSEDIFADEVAIQGDANA